MRNYKNELRQHFASFKEPQTEADTPRVEPDPDEVREANNATIERLITEIQFARRSLFTALDTQAAVIASALFGFLIAAGRDSNNNEINLDGLVFSFGIAHWVDSLREYSLLTSAFFLAFFSFQILGVLIIYGLVTVDLVRARSMQRKYHTDGDVKTAEKRLAAILSEGFFWRLARFLAAASYFPWVLGLVCFFNGLLVYMNWWSDL
jgi:ABC-type amino acid transport system permease subunit